MKIQDINGRTFGKLTVLSMVRSPLWKRPKWKCECACGRIRLVIASHLIEGHTRSCGCSRRESIQRHGHSCVGKVTREFHTWMDAKARTTSPTCRAYKDYGGRGITMCDRWLNSFEAFLFDMGPKPVGMTLERKDNDGPYSPDNCIWADLRTQANNKRTNRHICIDGVTKTASQWARSVGLKPSTLHNRYWRGVRGQELLEAI